MHTHSIFCGDMWFVCTWHNTKHTPEQKTEQVVEEKTTLITQSFARRGEREGGERGRESALVSVKNCVHRSYLYIL